MENERNVANGNFVFFGGTAGIGKAAAVELARRHANILLVARDRQAGAAAVAELQQEGAASAAFLAADLSTVAGVKAAADGVKAWKPTLHGLTHSAMTAFGKHQTTSDGLEFAFALQYLARALANRLLVDALSASGDGRIVHVAGSVGKSAIPDLDDLQYEQGKWGFFKAVLGTHALGFLHIQEATRRWADKPVTLTACCVGPTKTKAMQDKRMPLVMRLMGLVGTTPENSARNVVTCLAKTSAADASGAVLRKPKAWTPEKIDWDAAKAARLWDITERLAENRHLSLS
ncbi:SDR family NAD(P)-dependent oxidoreductase [Novosphingobium sp. BL-52-GroH]|uniref:SDR family NAD(P)-dependent oxidoreductase n=1 Tax=Novosphingobium sp. BL-52-GroH TaxID=3349877 RepID=UPI00384BD124